MSTQQRSVRKGGKVVFIEDDKFLNLAYKYGLEKEQYEVLSLSSTKPGFIEAVVQFKPNIIILDIIIQPVDGFTALSEIKKTLTLKNVPVIVFSNLKQDSDIKKCLDLGANEYLVKTLIDRKEFLEKINQYFKP